MNDLCLSNYVVSLPASYAISYSMNRYPEQLYEEAVHIQYAVDSRIDECIYQIFESYRTKGKPKNPYVNALTIVQAYNSRYEYWNDTDYSIYLELGKLNSHVTILYNIFSIFLIFFLICFILNLALIVYLMPNSTK